ncbi:MAG: hypothetical protein WDZ80_03240 [Candidatus Paceibacterota bacterium]
MIDIGSSWDSFERIRESINNMRALSVLPDGAEVTFNSCGFARPISIVPLSIVGLSKNLSFSDIPGYLGTIGFPSGQEVENYTDNNGTYLPLTRADLTNLGYEGKEQKLRSLSDIYISLLERNIITDKQFLQRIGKDVSALLITEMIDNIFEHSEASTSIIFSQYWPANDSCEICLADNGIGMYESLLSAGRNVKSDVDAMKKVIEDCLSAKDEFGSTKRGTGIRNAINLLSNNELNGYFCVISGTAGYYVDSQGRRTFLNLQNLDWNGTIVNMGFTKPAQKLDIYEYIR